MVPVAVVLAAVCLSCVAGVYVTHRLLRDHRKIIAGLLTHWEREVKDHVTSAAGTASGDTARRLDTLAGSIESLADATRAVLMHKTVITAQQDPGARKRA